MSGYEREWCMMERENELWGHFTEWAARLSFSLEKDQSLFHDARTEDGDPVEVKSCRRRTGRRRDHGKFFIRKENHVELRDAGGFYVFVVYDPELWKHGPILEMEMKPAAWLDDVEYGWTGNGSRRNEQVKRPPWHVVFPDMDVEDVVSEKPV